MKAVAGFLKGMNLSASALRLLTSPRMRALNSASIIQQDLCLSDFFVVDWLDDGAGGYRIMEEVEHLSDQLNLSSVFIAISHQPEIENALKAIGQHFGRDFHMYATRGSIHLVDTETRMLTKLFEP